MNCPQCFDAGWVLDAKIDNEPTTLEMIRCIYPGCEMSGRDVAVLCLYGEWHKPVFHPTTGAVMSLEQLREVRHAPSAF
jgi:nitrite reductase/ring-hydroxylating ferredoxin subunit